MPTHYYICAHLGFLHVCHRLTRYRRNADRATFSSSTSVCSLSFDDADCFMSFASLFSSDTEAATSSLCCSFISKDTSSILCVRMDVAFFTSIKVVLTSPSDCRATISDRRHCLPSDSWSCHTSGTPTHCPTLQPVPHVHIHRNRSPTAV